MPRRIFPAGTVTNTTGAALRLTFYQTSTTARREVDLYTVDASNNLSERIPNGVILTSTAAPGAYSAFAGPDDVDTLYLNAHTSSGRSTITSSGMVASATASLERGDLGLGSASLMTPTALAADSAFTSTYEPYSGNPGRLLSTGEETISRYALTSSGVAIATQRLALTYFTARKTETTTQVVIATGGTAAAATPTVCRIGVYSVDGSGNGTLVASIANDTTLFAGTFAAYTRSFSASLSKTQGQTYAVGVLVVTGAATPTFYGQAVVPLSNSGFGAGVAPRLSGSIASQSDLPSSFTSGQVLSTAQSPIASVLLP